MNYRQKGHMGLDFSPMAPIIVAIGSPMEPLATHPMVPLATVITIVANGDHHWRQWRSPFAAIGAIKMALMAKSLGDCKSGITIGDRRIRHWRQWCQWIAIGTISAIETIDAIGSMEIQWRQLHKWIHWHQWNRRNR